MIELIRLKAILDRLSSKERISIKKNILFEGRKKESFYTTQKIFDILVSSSDIDVNNICISLYGKVNLIALKKLLQRLTDKVLEILASKDLLLNSEIYDRRAKEVFNIRRKLLYYDILAAHGATNYALIILNQVIALAKKIEYYDYLMISLEKKLIKMSLGSGEINFGKVYKDIKHYSDCNSSIKNCIYLLRLYSSNYEYKQKLFSNENLLLAIKKVKEDYKRTGSNSVKIYIYYLEGIYYFNNEMYLKCKDNFKLFYKYLKSHPNIVYNSYLVTCLINISEMDTMLGNFEYSLRGLKKIINQFSRNEFNDKLIKEMIFINYFFMGDLEKALENVNILLDIKLRDLISSFLIAKRYFYLAVIYSIQGLFSDSNKLLANCQPLDKDKEGWNIGVRILAIINNIELGELDYVESQIENLRKHISRTRNESFLFLRFSIISKILIYLMNNSFNFIVVSNNYKKLFEKLRSNKSSSRWVLKSPEMIIFHEWFDAKVKGIPYDHTEIMKRLKRNNRTNN